MRPSKYMAKMVNATSAYKKQGVLTELDKCGIYYVCHMFTSQYYIFASSKCVQIHFFGHLQVYRALIRQFSK